MNEQKIADEQRTENAVPMLLRHVSAITDIAESKVKHVSYSPDDHFGFMCLCFVSRHVEHIHTLDVLIPHRDAGLVARSMFEGLVQLTWASADKSTRAHQWRSFGYIHDWRLLRSRIRPDSIPLSGKENAIIEGVALYGERFLMTKYQNRTAAAWASEYRSPTDPFYPNWKCGMRLIDMAREVEALDLYNELYGHLSDWAHWGTAGFGLSLNSREDGILYTSTSFPTAAQSLALAFQSLYQSLWIFDEHFGLGIKDEIERLRDEYIAEHKSFLSKSIPLRQ
jgi:hypothetical protein